VKEGPREDTCQPRYSQHDVPKHKKDRN